MAYSVQRTLRNMAWQRAKGELQAMLETFTEDPGNSGVHQFEALDNAVERFVNQVEDEGLNE